MYGLEADSANGWAPYRTSCATSVLRARSSRSSDPLFGVSDANEIVPRARRVRRPQRRLHRVDDHRPRRHQVPRRHAARRRGGEVQHRHVPGSPADGVGATPTIADVEAAGQTVTIHAGRTRGSPCRRTSPAAQCSYMLSPKWLQTPARRPAAQPRARRSTTPRSPRRRPTATRPSRSASARSSSSRTRRATATRSGPSRNPDYWRGPKGITGEDLPYLDAIEAVVAVDEDGRSNAPARGEFDVMMTANGDTITQFLDDDVVRAQLVGPQRRDGVHDAERRRGRRPTRRARTPPARCSTSTAAGRSPRRSTASGSARSAAAGLRPPANGPFPPGSVGYLEDNGYPAFDLDQGPGEPWTRA